MNITLFGILDPPFSAIWPLWFLQGASAHQDGQVRTVPRMSRSVTLGPVLMALRVRSRTYLGSSPAPVPLSLLAICATNPMTHVTPSIIPAYTALPAWHAPMAQPPADAQLVSETATASSFYCFHLFFNVSTSFCSPVRYQKHSFKEKQHAVLSLSRKLMWVSYHKLWSET